MATALGRIASAARKLQSKFDPDRLHELLADIGEHMPETAAKLDYLSDDPNETRVLVWREPIAGELQLIIEDASGPYQSPRTIDPTTVEYFAMLRRSGLRWVNTADIPPATLERLAIVANRAIVELRDAIDVEDTDGWFYQLPFLWRFRDAAKAAGLAGQDIYGGEPEGMSLRSLIYDADALANAIMRKADDITVITKRFVAHAARLERWVATRREQNNAKPQPKRERRGRPADTDPKSDRRIAAAWQTGHFRRFADVDREFGLPPGETKRAIDRNRKRPRGEAKRAIDRNRKR